MFNIIGRRKIWFVFSGLLLLVSIISLFVFGLNLGIDFTGGTLIQIGFKEGLPETTEARNLLDSMGLSASTVQPTGESEILFRLKPLENEEHQALLTALEENFGPVEEKRFETIGPTIGNELKRKAIIAIAVVLVCIVLYIAYAFRKVSKDFSSWKFGFCTIAALIHDVLITLGIFSLLGYFLKVEIDSLFVVALLTVLGYSVNDSIVVFDRTRYNLIKEPSSNFEDTVNRSVNQTLTRSVNTSATTLLVLLCIYLFGGETIKYFVLALIIGVISGTYSSIFVASPLLVAWRKFRR